MGFKFRVLGVGFKVLGFRVLDVGSGVLLWVMDRVRVRVRVRVGLSVRLSVLV